MKDGTKLLTLDTKEVAEEEAKKEDPINDLFEDSCGLSRWDNKWYMGVEMGEVDLEEGRD